VEGGGGGGEEERNMGGLGEGWESRIGGRKEGGKRERGVGRA